MAAGWTGTAQSFRESHVGLEIRVAVCGRRPGPIACDRLLPQLLGHAHPLGGTEARDSVTPVEVLRAARGVPVACHVAADVASDHRGHCSAGGGGVSDRVLAVASGRPARAQPGS